MTKLLQTLIDALAVGSLYALIALGYTMVYGVLQFINFAHSQVFMMGAWVSFLVAKKLGWSARDSHPPLWAIGAVMLSSMAFCGTLGLIIERLAYRPLRNAPRLNILITAIGVSLFLENVCQLKQVFGADPQGMPQLIADYSLFTVAEVQVRFVDVLIIGLAVSLMFVLQWLVYKTKLGLAMRAASHDQNVASLMGIPWGRTIAVTFFIGSSLAASAGLLYALKYPTLQQPSHASWCLLGLKAFVAAVVGGIGNIRGAMIGGLLIGLIEMFGSAYYSPHLRDVYVFTILIAVLLVRPAGILGKMIPEKV